MSYTSQPLAVRAEQAKTYPRAARYFELVMDACLHGATLFIPLFFCTWTLDSLELPKQTLLIFFSVVAVLAWLAKSVAVKSFQIHRSWLHVMVVLFVAGYGIIAWQSADRYLSFVGMLGQMPWSFVTLVSLLGLYFVAVHRIQEVSEAYDLLLTFLFASLLAGGFGLLQLLGIHILPSAISKTITFSTVGSIFSLAVYMVVPLVISAGLAFHGCRNNVCLLGSSNPLGLAARGVVWATMIVSLAVLVLTDYWVAWAALLFGTVLTVGLGMIRSANVGHKAKFAIPTILIAVSALLLWLPTPFKINLPAEVSPSASASWNIAKQALRDAPVFGTGQGTWIYNYAKYRDRMVNASPFWNIRFDRSFSQFLTLLGTVGIVGTALWLLLLVSVVVRSSEHLLKERSDDAWYATVTVFSGFATLAFLTFFYNENLPHVFASWLLLALLSALAGGYVWTWDQRRSKYAYEMMVTVFVIAAVAAVFVLWITGQRFLADAAFTRGVEAFRSSQNIDNVIAELDRARHLNSSADMYLRNLSQAHLIKAANLIQAQPTQEQAALIQSEIKAAVDLGLAATTMNPTNVENFSNLAVIYQSITSFTRGADEFAINYFRKAIELEPANPVFIGEMGKIYLLRADAYRTQMNDPDKAKAAEAKTHVEENLKIAEEVLRHAIEVKPDYMPAHYYLGVVYERQNRLKEAITQLATVLRENPNDVGVAFELSLLLYRDGQKPAAVSLMEEVVRADANNVNAKWYLAAMYEENGRVDEALVLVRDVAQRYPDNAAVRQRLELLESNKTSGRGLPEPVPQPISGSTDTNPVSR